MSSSKARLKVSSESTTLEIEVLDSNFDSVATSVGGLDVPVDPGLYEIRFREGSLQESQLMKAGTGVNVIDPPHFEPASPAPVANTATTFESHQEAVLGASAAIGRECCRLGPPAGGLLAMIRNVAGADDVPFPRDITKRLSVVGAGGTQAAKQRWQVEPAQGWALWSAAVPAGGYALRIASKKRGAASSLQSLWVDPGWQTMLFVPNTADGPAFDLATVHITRAGEWKPWADGSRVAIALESVLAGLRNSHAVVPEDLEQLFDAKFVNPFLGIAGAHALLLDPNRSLHLLQTVTENLAELLPMNPDVIALNHRARFAGAKVAVTSGVAWPPMLYAGYRALILADAEKAGIIADGSTAESAAARLLLSGLWTTWQESKPRPTRKSVVRRSRRVDDPATQRVRAYVLGAAELQDVSPSAILARRTPSQLGLATGLPSGAVNSAVDELRLEMPR